MTDKVYAVNQAKKTKESNDLTSRIRELEETVTEQNKQILQLNEQIEQMELKFAKPIKPAPNAKKK